MARTLNAFPDGHEQSKRQRYPWSEWLNGEVWELHRGSEGDVEEGKADFTVTTKSFASAVKQATTNRKGDVRIATLEGGETVVIQFMKRDDDGSTPASDE